MFVDDLNTEAVKVFGAIEGNKGKTCISTPVQIKLDVTVTSRAEEQISYPGKPSGAFPCTKLALPERVPVQVGKQGGENTPTPTPSAAASWRSLNALVLLLAAASTALLLLTTL